jgi:flagellar motor switch protein FliN/FliY
MLATARCPSRSNQRPKTADIGEMPARLESILKLEVPLIVQIARRSMKAGDVMSLVPGAIVELPKQADDELELLINNKVIGTGTAVKVGENFGVRVAYVGDLKQRVEAMGGTMPGGAPPSGAPAASPAPSALAEPPSASTTPPAAGKPVVAAPT